MAKLTRILTAITATCGLLAFSAAAADDSPFRMDKKLFKSRVKVVALSPIDAAPALQMPDSAEVIVQGEITKHLEKRGYEVIPASVLRTLRATMEQQVGGVQNASTGQVDNARTQAVREHSYRELMFRYPVDAVVAIRLQVVNAEYEADRAKWDGAKQRVKNKGSGRFKGTIAASSVSISIFDRNEKLLFTNRGGLEVLLERRRQQFFPLPPENYFQDEKRIRDAAKKAVKPL